MYCIDERLLCEFFFLKYKAEALTLEGACIEDLISAACLCGERDEQVRLAEREKLTDRIRSGSGNDDVSQGKDIAEFIFDILKLTVSFRTG